MRISLIVALAENGVIGRAGQIPWHLSADLRRFKQLTIGHHLIMGRKTFESIGRLLPGRTTVVLSRQDDFAPPGALIAHDLQQALQRSESADEDEAFIVGGAEVYRQALDLADRLYVTRVHARIEGDVRFPEFDESAWTVVEQSDHPSDSANDYESSFLVLERQRNGASRPVS